MSDFDLPGYDIIRNIFKGGMTDLYVAAAPSGQRVVIRMLKELYVRERRIRRKFLHGARILARLNHPNIIRQIEYGHASRRPYMILEYVEARTLRDLLIHRDPMLSQHILLLLRQMADALCYLHGRGYLHLDIKPENLLVAADGHVTLVDFDLAVKCTHKPVRLKEYPGTPAYVAPEILTTQRADVRADIFSFGVTAYEMLAFHKPFERNTLDESRIAQMDPAVPPTPLKIYCEHPPGCLVSLIGKCLAKDVNCRYPSMSLVIKHLEAIV